MEFLASPLGQQIIGMVFQLALQAAPEVEEGVMLAYNYLFNGATVTDADVAKMEAAYAKVGDKLDADIAAKLGTVLQEAINQAKTPA